MFDFIDPNNTGAKPLKKALDPRSPGILGERRIMIHLGAHKTATTYIQGILKKNVSALLEQGILYIPLDEMRRKGLTKAIIELSRSSRKNGTLIGLRQEILDGFDMKLLEKCHTVVISEENLSAGPWDFLQGLGYASLGSKLESLRNELGPNLHLFFCIRDYPSFLASIYVEILRHHPYCSFGEFLSGLYEEAPNLWSDVYRQLTELFGSDSVTFWDFEDTVLHAQPVLSMLTGATGKFAIDPSPVRESLSQRAIEFIRDFSKLPGSPLPPNVISTVANRLYPLSKLNGKFDPWTPRERNYLQKHYIEEKSIIPIKKFE